MNYLDLKKAKKIFSEGKNVTKFLRNEFNESENTSEIIEIAYDLQAGSYIEATNLNRSKAEDTAAELAELMEPHLSNQSSILDIGCGELTTLSLIMNKLNSNIKNVFAFDISLSRLLKGQDFYNQNYNADNLSLNIFVADIKQIPLHSKSIDIVTSSHALEPNGNNLQMLLKEIFRVAKSKCILFEPYYEMNSDEGKLRMEKLGYVKNIAGVVENLGGKILDIKLVKNISNSLNPTGCFVIEPPKTEKEIKSTEPKYSVPGTDFILDEGEHFFLSPDTGLIFPVYKNIPILKSGYGILGTSLFKNIQ